MRHEQSRELHTRRKYRPWERDPFPKIASREYLLRETQFIACKTRETQVAIN